MGWGQVWVSWGEGIGYVWVCGLRGYDTGPGCLVWEEGVPLLVPAKRKCSMCKPVQG